MHHASGKEERLVWEPTDIDETLGALSDLVHAGKVRVSASSAFPPEQVVAAQWVAERRGRERMWTEQPAYSILVRGIEVHVLPVAQAYRMGVLAGRTAQQLRSWHSASEGTGTPADEG